MSFRLVPKSVTSNDLERRNGRYFALFQRIRVASGAHCVEVHVRYLISWWVLVVLRAGTNRMLVSRYVQSAFYVTYSMMKLNDHNLPGFGKRIFYGPIHSLCNFWCCCRSDVWASKAQRVAERRNVYTSDLLIKMFSGFWLWSEWFA